VRWSQDVIGEKRDPQGSRVDPALEPSQQSARESTPIPSHSFRQD
jgi:hypothetical protein